MAEGYLRHFARNKAIVYSAGIETHDVNPHAIAAMKADGIDISDHTSNHISEYDSIAFDFVITVCDHAQENCPLFATKAKKFHHNFPDPAKAKGNQTEITKAFESVREIIKSYCAAFAKQNL